MVPRDGRHGPLVPVLERLAEGGVVVALEVVLDDLGGVLGTLNGALSDAGHAGDGHHVADDEHVRLAFEGEVGFDRHPAGPVDLGALALVGDHLAQRAGRDSGRPHLAGALDAAFLAGLLVLDLDAHVVDVGDHRVGVHLDAHLLQPALGFHTEVLPHRRQHERRTVEQHHPAFGRVDGAKRPGQRALGQFDDLAGQLHTGGSAADDDERQPPGALERVGGDLGRLERAEDAPAHLQGVIDGLHPGGEGGEVVVAEVVLLGAGRHDQVVEGQDGFHRHQLGGDGPGLEVDVLHLAEQHLTVLVPLEDQPGGGREVTGRQDAGGQLVEQRLE